MADNIRTLTLVEVLKLMGHELTCLHEQARAIKGGSDADKDRKGALYDRFFEHPVYYLCRLIEEATGIDRNIIVQASKRLHTILGLAPLIRTRSSADLDQANSAYLPDDPLRDIPDLRWLLPKLNECDVNGTTATIFRRFEAKHPGVLSRFCPNTAVVPITPATEAPTVPAAVPTIQPTEAPTVPAADQSIGALLTLFTNGLANERIEEAAQIVRDDKLSVHEKLTKINVLIRFPATASAEQLGDLFGVTKQAVLKTAWWIENRQGEKQNEIGRRRIKLKSQSESMECPETKDEG